MPINKQRNHIISYDIGSPKRLGRIHRYLKNHATPIQYSVFLIQCTPLALQQVIIDLQNMIEPDEDDIRFYTLPVKPTIMTLGQQGVQPGIQLLGVVEDDYHRML